MRAIALVIGQAGESSTPASEANLEIGQKGISKNGKSTYMNYHMRMR
jgi:hypothetical protein